MPFGEIPLKIESGSTFPGKVSGNSPEGFPRFLVEFDLSLLQNSEKNP